MSAVSTEEITLNLTSEAAQQLRAFTAAIGGNIHNQADNVLRVGISALVALAPSPLGVKYHRALADLRSPPLEREKGDQT